MRRPLCSAGFAPLLVLSCVLAVHAEPDSSDGGVSPPGSPASYHPAPSPHVDGGVRALDTELPSGARVLRIPIEGTIDLGLSAFVRRALEQHRDVQLVLLDVNTLGGRVDAAIQIRDALLESEVKTVAFVHPRAISAGALISLACDVIAISPGGSIGAATPITMGGGKQDEAVEEKMVSYMRTEMRTTAEAKGRRGDVAEAMVDRSVEIEGVVQAGKLLTLDTDRALALGIADVEAKSRAALFEALGIESPVVIDESPSWAEAIARFLTDPTVSGLLMTLGMLGLLIELYSPGVGLPGAIGVTCLLAFFLGHAVADLAGLEEVLLVLLGLGLLAIEVFVIPGFGVVGVAGIVCVLAGLVLSLVGLPLDVSFDTGLLSDAVFRVSLALVVAVGLGLVAIRFLPRTPAGRRLVLSTATDVAGGFVAARSEESLLGERGVATTDLHPSGKAELAGRRVDVVSEGDYIKQGEAVRVIEVRSGRVVVRRAGEESEA